jgi:hypothetical protein
VSSSQFNQTIVVSDQTRISESSFNPIFRTGLIYNEADVSDANTVDDLSVSVDKGDNATSKTGTAEGPVLLAGGLGLGGATLTKNVWQVSCQSQLMTSS